MRRIMFAALAIAVCRLSAAPVKIHGYITSISSPHAFEIDSYRITRDASLQLELDRTDYPDAAFGDEDLQIGTELDVQGEFNDSTHELHATAIKVVLSDNVLLKRTVVVEHGTFLQRDGNGWQGTIRADGQIIRVDEHTHLQLKEDQTNHITPGLAVSYEGRKEHDSSIRASRLEILPNVAGKEEQKLWRESTPRINSNGELMVHGAKYKLVADAEVQSYAHRIGAKLVPGYYGQELSSGAARLITFEFYVVENPAFNAHAFPNGTVLVNSGVFRVLTNEAQFAAVLGHEIAHATQEHAFREFLHRKKADPAARRENGFIADPALNAYSRMLENQADRLGLEYMVTAGYDAREAAEVWKHLAAAPKQQETGYWTDQDQCISRRSYVLSQLRASYADVDFRSYVRNDEQFDILAERFGNTAIAQRPPEAPISKSLPQRPGYQAPHHIPAARADQQRYGANAVTINCDPAGADVVLNGRIIGKTPLTLPTGNVDMPYIITVQKPGYQTWTGQLVSVPGRTAVRVELIAGP